MIFVGAKTTQRTHNHTLLRVFLNCSDYYTIRVRSLKGPYITCDIQISRVCTLSYTYDFTCVYVIIKDACYGLYLRFFKLYALILYSSLMKKKVEIFVAYTCIPCF